MNNPVKLIWKYKNDNRRVQYNIYYFIGNVPNNIFTILKKIENLNFYDSLIELHDDDYSKLEKYYGNKWYQKFFNYYHLNLSISVITETSSQKNELIEKYGDKWYNEHIENYNIIDKKLIYSYAGLIKDELRRKLLKKEKGFAKIKEIDENEDYSTSKKIDVFKISKSKTQSGGGELCKECNSYHQLVPHYSWHQHGGDDEDDEDTPMNDYEVNDNEDNLDDEDEITKQNEEDEEEEEFPVENISDKLQEEIDEDVELENLYESEEIESNTKINETSNLIKKALKDDKIFDKNEKNMISFDNTKDNESYDENLRDVYKKIYVKTQYIYNDDSIKAIKEKIAYSLKNNEKFGEENYLIPSRTYLWSEYIWENKIEKIMIGQKWMRKNELLNIDIEPLNNIRIYEELKKPFNTLKDNIKRYNNKIRREEDETNILEDYQNYITNNEIFMIDIYNEFGLNYSPDGESSKNLQDIYLRIYFPRIRPEDFTNIIDFLNKNPKSENLKCTNIFETINNDMILENKVVDIVENAKLKNNYKSIFKENYITQSVIHVNLRTKNNSKIDLYRIFEKFKTNETYPFVQYQTIDTTIRFKLNNTEIEKQLGTGTNNELLSKWFENAPYGISFKVKITDKGENKYTAVNLNENGRIEYKTQWKEEDMATIDDIKTTYIYVKKLLEKINSESNRGKFETPDDSEFKFAFINTIQKFELPEKFVINHNDLSDFSRNFYPYISLVIDPRKRQAKIQKDIDKSKFGTYLRYKKVSKYENQAKIEQRILYFMRNFEYTEQQLVNEIAKQFNITMQKAEEEYEKIKQKHPHVKKARKNLKKIENVPKYKPPGIGIDIQGKQRENYKIRISGARTKEQLNRIVSFLNVFFFLYIETYLYKKPEYQVLKEMLKSLTNIAKRRSKVEELLKDVKEVKSIKQMTQMDKKRIGFKPEKDQNQWTRMCQNSGENKRRQPKLYSTNNIAELVKKGYSFNKKTGLYEKKIISKINGKKQEEILKTIKLADFDEHGNPTGQDIHYACNPEDNGEHYYVGFLNKGLNPNGQCMPCCFIKDPSTSKNKAKQDFFNNCLLDKKNIINESGSKNLGEKLYILQDTNKIQEGRLGDLPKYIDIYFNKILNRQKIIKHHYLTKTTGGYFFKYGSKQDKYQFLNAISTIVDMDIEKIKKIFIAILEKDTNEQIFSSLNEGNIRTQFKHRSEFIKYINESEYLDYDYLIDLITMPEVLLKTGINVIIFVKKVIIIKKVFEKEKTIDDFVLDCSSINSIDSIIDENRNTIFLIKEGKNYYPIVEVEKNNENDKEFDINKIFKYKNTKDNIVNHILDFYNKNCGSIFFDKNENKNELLDAVEMKKILIATKNKEYFIKHQFVDRRNKCRYLILNNSTIIPVLPSGSIYNIPIVKSLSKYILDFKTTVDNVNKLYEETNKKLPVKIVGTYYNKKINDEVHIVAVVTISNDIIEIIPQNIKTSELDKMELFYEDRPLTDKIDDELSKDKHNFIIDKRIIDVNRDIFNNEAYQLFRLEFSNYIIKPENKLLYDKIHKLIANQDIIKRDKMEKIKKILFRLIDKNLYQLYLSVAESKEEDNDIEVIDDNVEDNQSGGDDDSLEIVDDDSDLTTLDTTDNGNTLDTTTDDTNIEDNGNTLDTIDDTLDIDTTTDDTNIQEDNGNTLDTTDDTLDIDTTTDDNQTGGKYDKLLYISPKEPNYEQYQLNNERDICEVNNNKDTCNNNPHCHWTSNGCKLAITRKMIILFVNKIAEELATFDSKAYEVMQIDDYFVSDIVDKNNFTQSENQTIIKSTGPNLKKALSNIFGKEFVPNIGRKKTNKITEVNYQQLNADNYLVDMNELYIQKIIENNLSIFRAYVNGYYWNKNEYNDPDNKNLGYYSPQQTDLSTFFRSKIIDWLNNKKNKEIITKDLPYLLSSSINKAEEYLNKFIIKLAKDELQFSNCIIELYVLSKVNINIPIIVYNEDDNVIYIFDNGIKYNSFEDGEMSKGLMKYIENKKKNINIRFTFTTNKKIPSAIEILYYK